MHRKDYSAGSVGHFNVHVERDLIEMSKRAKLELQESDWTSCERFDQGFSEGLSTRDRDNTRRTGSG